MSKTPRCFIVYHRGRKVISIGQVNPSQAKTCIALLEQPMELRVRDANILRNRLKSLVDAGKFDWRLEIQVELRSTESGLTVATHENLPMKSAVLMSQLLDDPRDNGRELLIRGLKSFITHGTPDELHPFLESELSLKVANTTTVGRNF